LIVNKPGKYTDDQFTTNWDREFAGGRDKISARFFFSNAESFSPVWRWRLAGFLGRHPRQQQSASHGNLEFCRMTCLLLRAFTFNETHLFFPTLVNDFRFGYVRINK